MKIGVTGAPGGLGMAILENLARQRERPQLVGITRNPSQGTMTGVEYRQGDYSDPASYAQAVQGLDALLLVSGVDVPEKRVVQHRTVIAAARANGVRKLVYTSIVGSAEKSGFFPIVASNRETEADLRASGLDWCIGRNGLYLEPDLEYLDRYRELGRIRNCAGEGRCAYTTRGELGYAYARLLLADEQQGQTFNLVGDALSQPELAVLFNRHFGCDLHYAFITPEEYRADRVRELGEYVGGIVAGIYEGIALGFMDVPSEYQAATGRPHIGWDEWFAGKAGKISQDPPAGT